MLGYGRKPVSEPMNDDTTTDDRSPAAAGMESRPTDCLSGHAWCPGPDADDDDPLCCFDCYGVDCVEGHEWCDGVLPRPQDRLTGLQCADCLWEFWAVS